MFTRVFHYKLSTLGCSPYFWKYDICYKDGISQASIMEGKARYFFVAHMFQTRNPISKVPKRPNFMRATRIPCYSSKWLGQFWCFFPCFFPCEMVPQFLATFYVLLFLQVSFKTSKVDDYYIYSYVFEEDLKWHQFFLHFATCASCIKVPSPAFGTVWKCWLLEHWCQSARNWTCLCPTLFDPPKQWKQGQKPFHDVCASFFLMGFRSETENRRFAVVFAIVPLL